MKCKNENCKEKNLKQEDFTKRHDGAYEKTCTKCLNLRAKLKAREKAAERNKYNFV